MHYILYVFEFTAKKIKRYSVMLKDVLRFTEMEHEKSNIIEYSFTNPKDPEIFICSAINSISKHSELLSFTCQSSWHKQPPKGKRKVTVNSDTKVIML